MLTRENQDQELQVLKKQIQAQALLIKEKEAELHGFESEIFNYQSKIDQYESELQFYQKENSKLEETAQQLEVKSQDLESENAQLWELVRLLKHHRFGRRSEIVSSKQLGLFNEAEQEAKEALEGQEEQVEVSYKRSKPKRRKLSEHLPREEVVIELEGKDRLCPHDGHEMSEIGQETSEQLEMIPAQVKVIRTIRKKYACKHCESAVKTAPLPPQPLPKSMAGPGLLSYITVSKYLDGLPLYRLEKILERIGGDVSRGSLANWMIRVGELLMPVKNLLIEEAMEGDYLQCDETRVQVLKEEGKKAESLSYMWVRRSRWGPNQAPVLLFDYFPDRSGKSAKDLLEGFRGYLQVDGYGGYDEVCTDEEVVRLGCWAHGRRKFFEAGKGSKNPSGRAGKALKYIKQLYKIEADCRELVGEERYKIRLQKAKPLLGEFKAWLDQQSLQVAPKSLLGKAIEYNRNQWPYLERYLEDGRLEIDNNLIENAIRPFAIGRKNWLFSDTVKGAEASATIYSVIQTAIANGHDAYSYIRYLLSELPKANTLEDIEALLPYKLAPQKITAWMKTLNTPVNFSKSHL